MNFNEMQSRLWGNMINAIKNFRKGKINYFDLVYELEGALDAGDFKDKKLIEQWYNHWTPLEILSAQKGKSATIDEANKYLQVMDEFLRKNYSCEEE